MPRSPRPWFRFYVETIDDPKLARLTPSQCWLWTVLMTLARKSCEPGRLLVAPSVPISRADLVRISRLKARDVDAGMATMAELRMVSLDNNCWSLPNFLDRQYEGDPTNAERQRRYRQKQSVTGHNAHNALRNASSVTPDTETDTETETEVKTTSPSVTAVDPLRGFPEFWNAYPKRNGKRLGRGLCEAKWKTFSLDDRRAAYHGAVNYAAAIDAGITIAKDPIRFLKGRVWEDWQTPAIADPERRNGEQPRIVPLRLDASEL